MSCSTDQYNLYRRLADCTGRTLKGARPADMPVEQPTKFKLVIKPRNARTLCLTITQSWLVQADEVMR